MKNILGVKYKVKIKNADNLECLLKRMLYCPGKGQELLSALGVNLECHASSVFLVLKPPLSIIDALSKSIAWLLLISTQPRKNSYLELVPTL